MRPYLVGLAMLCVILAGIAHSILSAKHPKAESKLPYLVRLHDKRTGRFFCSGSVVSDKYILTAAHCVVMEIPMFGVMLNPEEIEVRTVDGSPTGVFVRAKGAQVQADLALLTGNLQGFEHIHVATLPNEIIKSFQTQHLVACGFPYGGRLYCNQLQFEGTYAFSMRATGYLFPGMSGGPVIDLDTGNIVGVNSAAGPGFVLIAPTIELFSALDN